MTTREELSAIRSNIPSGRRKAAWTDRFFRSLALQLAQTVVNGRLTIRLPSGDELLHFGLTHEPGDPSGARIDINRGRGIIRAFAGGAAGLERGYVDGDWDAPELVDLIMFAARNREAFYGHPFSRAIIGTLTRIRRLRHLTRANTRAGSRRNIASHYDLGNSFYSLWLDKGMTYSSAFFHDPDDSLETAQQAKYHRLAEALGLQSGMEVLEIGCGWGAFSEILARDYGCRVTALTVSQAQYDYARNRIAHAGLANSVDIRFQDYRDVEGKYDRIASIEMLEAVGEKFWAGFFKTMENRLAHDGIIGLQAITIKDERYKSYRRGADFIQTYIFPGGMLPSPSLLGDHAKAGGFEVSDAFTFGKSYADTLGRWSTRFEEAWHDIAALGFDERFRRIWNYYLAYSEAGFRLGTINVGQYLLKRREG